MDALTLFGLGAVSLMLLCYALDQRSCWFGLGFAGACALGSAYGFLQGAWPFGVVEAIWAVVAWRRWAAARSGVATITVAGTVTRLSKETHMTTQPAAWHPDTLHWAEIAPDGTRYTLLEGRRDLPGEAFTYAFFIPAGFWDPGHWHTADARIVVLKGTLHLGYGNVLDISASSAYPTGSVVLVPAGMRHFDGAHEDTVIIGTAVGPWSTHYVDPSHTASAGTPE
jgi:hypothetical protein